MKENPIQNFIHSRITFAVINSLLVFYAFVTSQMDSILSNFCNKRDSQCERKVWMCNFHSFQISNNSWINFSSNYHNFISHVHAQMYAETFFTMKALSTSLQCFRDLRDIKRKHQLSGIFSLQLLNPRQYKHEAIQIFNAILVSQNLCELFTWEFGFWNNKNGWIPRRW